MATQAAGVFGLVLIFVCAFAVAFVEARNHECRRHDGNGVRGADHAGSGGVTGDPNRMTMDD